MQVHEDERVCFVVLYACICVCSFVRGCVCVCYRGLNSYQYYFLGFLIISNCTIKEPPNPILIIKAPTFCVCVFVWYRGTSSRKAISSNLAGTYSDQGWVCTSRAGLLISNIEALLIRIEFWGPLYYN